MNRAIHAVLVATLCIVATVGCKSNTVTKSERDKQPKVDPKAKALDIVPPEQYKPVVGRRGGRIVWATLGEPKSFNPITSGETSTTEYTSRIFLGLTASDAWTFEPEPELATEWTPDETGKIWTVKLREGVTWSDGEPFTADDVLFTYETIYDERWPCSARDIITGPNGEQWKLEKVDDHTVKFILPSRYAIFPALLSQAIIPKHKFKPLTDGGKFNEALGTTTDPADLVGTGPFLLESYETGAKVIMSRNPRYYKKDAEGTSLPYLDTVIFVIVPSQDVQILKFRQKETDLTSFRGADYPAMKPREAEDNFTTYKLGPASGSQFLFFNQNTGKNPENDKPFVEPHKLRWFRDVRFRRAVSHAIDRKFIVNAIMNGLGYPQYGPMNHNNRYLPFCNPEAPRYEYDIERARVLLKEMDLIDRNGDGILEDAYGHDVSFNLITNSGNTVRETIAETIRKDLAKLGMEANYRPMNFNTMVSKLDDTCDWDACIIGLTGDPEPHHGANVWKSSGRMHMWFPRQEEPSTSWEARIDKLFAEGISELDPMKRREIYLEWQEIVGEQQPFIYTAAGESIIALRNGFGNIFPSPLGGVTHNLEEIYVLED